MYKFKQNINGQYVRVLAGTCMCWFLKRDVIPNSVSFFSMCGYSLLWEAAFYVWNLHKCVNAYKHTHLATGSYQYAAYWHVAMQLHLDGVEFMLNSRHI